MAKVKKKGIKVEPEGKVFIQASFNNIIITFTNSLGQVISWSSAGKVGFKGSKKNTPYAAQVASDDASKKAYEAGLRRVEVFVKGPGGGRESAIRNISANNIDITLIRDMTPVPHNGCRPPKRRRI